MKKTKPKTKAPNIKAPKIPMLPLLIVAVMFVQLAVISCKTEAIRMKDIMISDQYKEIEGLKNHIASEKPIIDHDHGCADFLNKREFEKDFGPAK